MRLPLLVLTLLYALSPLSFAADAGQLQSQVQRLTGIMLEQEQLLQQQAQELRQLQGDNELMRHQLQSIEDRQNDLYADIDQRIGNMRSAPENTPILIDVPKTPISKSSEQDTETESKNPEGKPLKPTIEKNTETKVKTETPAPAPKPVSNLMANGDMSAKQAYKAAFNLIQMRQYPQAVLAFHMFLKQHGGTDYADNAQYWLGEAYYAQRDYNQAIAIFRELMEKYPSSPKRAHALLKSAFAYDSLNDKLTAKKYLKQLRQQYPNSATARLALERLQRLQAEE